MIQVYQFGRPEDDYGLLGQSNNVGPENENNVLQHHEPKLLVYCLFGEIGHSLFGEFIIFFIPIYACLNYVWFKNLTMTNYSVIFFEMYFLQHYRHVIVGVSLKNSNIIYFTKLDACNYFKFLMCDRSIDGYHGYYDKDENIMFLSYIYFRVKKNQYKLRIS